MSKAAESIKDFDASILQPGDVLLYSGTGLVSRLIQLKTWSRYSHCEVYDRQRTSVASRDGIGVGRYLLRLEGLRVVLRPRVTSLGMLTIDGHTIGLDMSTARAWFDLVNGQKYDWVGLLGFLGTRFQGKSADDKMFCSEFATRFLRKAGFDPFNGYDADGIAPSEFAKNSEFDVVWSADGEPFAARKAA